MNPMMGFFVIAAVAALGVGFYIRSRHPDKIREKTESFGYTLLSVERRNFFTGLGPFHIVGKGRTVYRFEYQDGKQIKEGWVRFGGLLGADWRF